MKTQDTDEPSHEKIVLANLMAKQYSLEVRRVITPRWVIGKGGKHDLPSRYVFDLKEEDYDRAAKSLFRALELNQSLGVPCSIVEERAVWHLGQASSIRGGKEYGHFEDQPESYEVWI